MQDTHGKKKGANDAAAIYGAASQPATRFVPANTVPQQVMLAFNEKGSASLLTCVRSATVRTAAKRTDRISLWLAELTARVGWQKAVVALANRNARILWAVLARGHRFDADHVSVMPGGPSAPPAASLAA